MITIINLEPRHWPTVATIYEQGIATGMATFQTEVPTWEFWDQTHIKTCRLVALYQNELVGFTALTSTSNRTVYAGVAELSIYIAQQARGKQIGTQLLQALITQSEQHGFWTLQASVFPQNTASLAVHKKNGFREIGYRERVALLNNQWHNNILLERRSTVVG